MARPDHLDLRTYACPACKGCGSYWTAASGCGNDPDAIEWTCADCNGTGKITMDRFEAHDLGLERAPGPAVVAHLRKPQRHDHRLAQRYGAFRQHAVSPVNLPDLRP
jgi:hypothetical protein